RVHAAANRRCSLCLTWCEPTMSQANSPGGTHMTKREPNPIDRHVGARLRLRRMLMDMSQGELGSAIGVTFQQVQKYEKGSNRIGASRLQQISRTLAVPIGFFFEGAPLPLDLVATSDQAPPPPSYLSDF